MAEENKVDLHLANARAMSLDDILNLFRKVSGREPTPEEVEEARREFEQGGGSAAK